MKYKVLKDGEWVRPVMKGYKMMCCDCGLVHDMDFRVIKWGRGHKIEFKADRNYRSTGQARRTPHDKK